jgi:hypothetical protein
MSDRPWFFVSQGKQQGPYPEAQLRALIAQGLVTPETLVWSEGMPDWQKARDIPGLLSSASGPRAVQARQLTSIDGSDGGPLSLKLELWPFFGWTLLNQIGLWLVIPAPWVATAYYRWMILRLKVPGRPDLGFTGRARDIWYVFIALGLAMDAAFFDIPYLLYLEIPVQALLLWMILRWVAANFSSKGQRLPIAFEGSALIFIGWQVLLSISFITIIGWAWVIPAIARWICRNISGTRRAIVFSATGWQVLWRTMLCLLGSVLVIPIPWIIRWYTQWFAAQFALVPRAQSS